MILYSPKISSRLRYIADFAGVEIQGYPIEITSNPHEYISSPIPKINYSHERLSENECWIVPHPLLFEEGIQPLEIQCEGRDEKTIFFKTGGDYPFDLFAAAFYLLSRYEEYLPAATDEFGRFDYQNCLAFHNNFLSLPLVNIWLNDFAKTLNQNAASEVLLQDKKFTLLPTYDIDEAYSYRYKGIGRTIGGLGKAILNARWDQVRRRINVLRGRERDPFDSYQWMDEIHSRLNLKPKYFFLVPDRLSIRDRNISPQKEVIRELIVAHDKKYQIGVHPSWQSGDHPELIRKEIQRIENMVDHPIISSRQHFIRFALPETYRHLIAAGIKEEFSMGYGSINGFRASVSSPFYWFDLEKNKQTDLKVFPFCFMDANSFFEQKLSPAKAKEELITYYEKVKAVNGTLVIIFHNTFLGSDPLFSGWRAMYSEALDFISNKEG